MHEEEPAVVESGDDVPEERLRNPNQAAEALGVSPSGLRRLAEIYATVRGELPREPGTRSRLWPRSAVRELATARRLVLERRFASIREALEAIGRGDDLADPGEKATTAGDTLRRVVPDLTTELRELRVEVAGIREELSRLNGAVAALLSGREAATRPASTLGPAENELELHELRRRLRYLEAELEVRGL
jgi:hypothetical protein